MRFGMVDVRPVHDLRHHAATTMLRRGKTSVAHVQHMLGHQNIQSTMRYAHVDGEDVRAALRHAYDTTSDTAEKTPLENNAVTASRKSF
jgi:site-specific recombinase XerD